MKRVLIIISLFLFLSVNANTVKLDCPDTEFNELTYFSCVVKATSKNEFDKVEFDLNYSDKLSLLEVRSNFKSVWDVNIKNGKLTARTKRDRLVSGNEEFSLLLFTAIDYGKADIELKNIKIINSKEKETVEVKDVKQKVKTLSNVNTLKSIKINNEKIKVPLNSEEIILYEVDDKEEVFNIDAKLTDKTSKLKYDKKISLKEKDELYTFISVESENGINNIYTIKFYKKETSIKLNSFKIIDEFGSNLPFTFDSTQESFYIEVDPEIDYIKIKPEVNDGIYISTKSLLSGDLKYGNNILLIKLYDDNSEKTYVVNVFRLLSKGSSNSYLKKIEISDHNIKFNKKIYNYNIIVDNNISSLNIEALTEHENASVHIIGNDNLENNSVIRIMVTAENGKKSVYNINVEKKFNVFSYMSTIIYSLIALTSIFIIYKVFNKYELKEIIIEELDKPRFRVKPKINASVVVNIKHIAEDITVIKSNSSKKQSK